MGNDGDEMRRRELLRRRIGWALLVGMACLAAVGASVGARRVDAGASSAGVVVIDTTLGYQGSAAAGTGMVLDATGRILTNNHVIRGATSIAVVVPATGRSYDAEVAGYDVRHDVALLRISRTVHLKTVRLGSSANLHVGQAVTAVGNAGGTGSLSSTAGAITGVSRTITATDGAGDSEQLTGLIETDAHVVSGDSGGPLENRSDQVIGMVTAASADGRELRQTVSGDGFAIPIATARAIARQITVGRSSASVHVGPTPFLGVALETVGLRSAGGPGALVTGVSSGTPAARAGLAAGDVIFRIDGRAIVSATAARLRLLRRRPGERATLVYRDESGRTHTVSVVLASGPPQ